MKVLLPTTLPLNPTLPEGVEGIHYDVSLPIPDEHLDAEVLVDWELKRRMIHEAAGRLPNLKLVQALSAGADGVLGAPFDDSVTICSGVGLHDLPVTEHALALIFALIRKLPECLKAQERGEWSSELGGSQPFQADQHIATLRGAQVLIWGFGSIGQSLAPVLSGLGAQVRGVARSAGERAGFETITENDLPTALPETDLLVMILPGIPSTVKALNAERLALLPKTALMVNVGRGTTVDEDDLLTALQEGVIAGAAIDVTAKEPLPQESGLWDAPNLVITPHAAGGRPVGADDLIATNVSALLSGGEFRNKLKR